MLLENSNPLPATHPPALTDPSPFWLDPLLLCQSDKNSLLEDLRDQRAKTGGDLVGNPSRASQSRRVSKPRQSSRNYISREQVSPERGRHLEKNRLAATKCRWKKKQENEMIQGKLDSETVRRESLLSEVKGLKEELWHLKNSVFAHANCEDQFIKTQLAIMSQNVLGASPPPPLCPSPTFSASTQSDNSLAMLDPGAQEDQVNITDRYGLEDLLDGFIDPTKL